MNIKINNKKYKKLDYARLKEFVDNAIKQSKYDICIETDESNWLQIFKENGYVSIANRIGKKVSQYYKLNNEDKIHDIIKQYFFNGKLILEQKPDETINAKDKSILNMLGSIIVVIAMILMIFSKKNQLFLSLCLLLFSIGLMLATIKPLINNEYDKRNDVRFFIGVFMFFASLFMFIHLLKY